MDLERKKLLDHIESKKASERSRKILEDIREYVKILNSRPIDGIENLIDQIKERI